MNMVPNLTRKVVWATEATLLKVCRNHIPHVRPPPPAATLIEASRSKLPATPTTSGQWKSYGNPCIDMFYYLLSDLSLEGKDLSASHDLHMKRLLPHAWSYSPLTTLKIIRNLEYLYPSPMCDAIYWLHHNHPKTLAANLIPLLINLPRLTYQALITILYRIVDLKQVESSWEKLEHVKEINKVVYMLMMGAKDNIQGPLMVLSNKMLDMYERDPDFRCLHDEIAHLFAESLKFDIQNFLKKEHDYDYDKDRPLEVTVAADYCEASPFLLECVAKRVFPHVAKVEAAIELLRNEVLDPLKKVLSPRVADYSQPPINIYGYRLDPAGLGPELWRKKRREVLHKYLKDFEQSLEKMVADALLPNELVGCLIGRNAGDVPRQVIELQWKAMVEDMKKKNKETLSSSLALIQTFGMSLNDCNFSELTCAMTILISELREEEAWKGKVISLTPEPQLLSIQGHDLKSKCEFLCDPATMLTPSRRKFTDCREVFDLILQQAVNTSLKPEQMIKKIFVFSAFEEYEWVSSGAGGCWERQDYDEMRRKYMEHGYDTPQIVFWRSNPHLEMPFSDTTDERGISAVSGFFRAHTQHNWAVTHFVKMFLENDGHVSPQNFMDAILSDEDYNYPHRFVVLD